MADIPSSSDAEKSEPKLVSFSTLKTIARQLPRYRYAGQGGGVNAGGGGGGDGGGQSDKFGGVGGGTGGRDNKKVPRNMTTAGGLVTLDMVNGKLVSNIHGISLIQVRKNDLIDIYLLYMAENGVVERAVTAVACVTYRPL